MTIIKRDSRGICTRQEPCNGFDISYNHDDGKFYVCDLNEWGELHTRHKSGGAKGFANAREWARKNTPTPHSQ